ncbi:MAG: hypothetical protein WCO56_10070 [Verrucomicrobiota bacterium]
MKRPRDDEDSSYSSSESNAEEFLANFLQRHPRFFIYVGIGLVALIVIAVVVTMIASKRQ